MRIGSLFSGAGGLDMAVEAVFGGEVIWHSELDKAASKVLAHRWPGVPNLGDITKVDWSDIEPVDILCGGFPCQDVSAAGKRAGIKDGTRSGLWAIFSDAIDALRPPLVIIENVRGLLSAKAHRSLESNESAMGNGAGRPVLRAIGAVLGDLSDLGYDARWATVAAASVGAPHRRERVFILATDSEGERSLRGGIPFFSRVSTTVRGSSSDAGVALLPTPCTGDGEGGRQYGRNGTQINLKGIARVLAGDASGLPDCAELTALLPTPRSQDGNGYLQGPDADIGNNGHTVSLADRVTRIPRGQLLPTPNASDGERGGQHPDKRYNADGLKHAQKLIDYVLLEPDRWGKYAPAIARWEQIAGSVPAPTEPNRNGNPRLNPAFSEWMMGWPPGWVTDPDIGISRNDQLRIVGNGVCTQQAIAALRYLLAVTA